VSECQTVERKVTIELVYSLCETHGHPLMHETHVEHNGISVENIAPDLLSIIEQLLAARYGSDPTTTLYEHLNRDWSGAEGDGWKLDASEQQRFANMVANQLLQKIVRERRYARVAGFVIADD
jgi:hypothetical protein